MTLAALFLIGGLVTIGALTMAACVAIAMSDRSPLVAVGLGITVALGWTTAFASVDADPLWLWLAGWSAGPMVAVTWARWATEADSGRLGDRCRADHLE